MYKTILYISLFIAGLFIGALIVHSYYNKMVLENRFRQNVLMTKIDQDILELMEKGNIVEAKKLLLLKYEQEMGSLKVEWVSRGDSMYKEILFSPFPDKNN